PTPERRPEVIRYDPSGQAWTPTPSPPRPPRSGGGAAPIHPSTLPYPSGTPVLSGTYRPHNSSAPPPDSRPYTHPLSRTPVVPLFSPAPTDLITPVPHGQTPAPSTRLPSPPGPIQVPGCDATDLPIGVGGKEARPFEGPAAGTDRLAERSGRGSLRRQ
ncbi:hypothetical protein P7K49_038753, partial [Saguinus oedipus]